MISDHVKIIVEAGKGGDGVVSFRREKYVPKGGPDGGDGGRGGDVLVRVNRAVHTLSNFGGKKYFKAEDGQPGGKARRTGKSGDDLALSVPPGTQILRQNGETWETFADLTDEGQSVTIAKGGNGGWGNVHFATSTNQTPERANLGKPGEKYELVLDLKLIADVGIIGMPNAGKSTLLSIISRTQPKIADYPFTTLEPNLGTVDFDDCGFVAADIPGLIEGASRGKGLGHDFLKHAERTRLIVHLIDASSENPTQDYKTIKNELKEYDISLAKKPEIIIVNKTDIIDAKKHETLKKDLRSLKKPVIFISAATGAGIKDFLSQICQKLSQNK